MGFGASLVCILFIMTLSRQFEPLLVCRDFRLCNFFMSLIITFVLVFEVDLLLRCSS